MAKLDQWIDNKIGQNVFVWLFILLIFTIVIQAENRILTSLVFIVFIMPLVYINNLKILPLFFKRQVKLGIVFSFLNISLFTFIGVLFLSDFFKTYQIRMLSNVFGGVLLILIFGTALKLAKDSFVRRQQEKEAELKLLKAQLNPHFLFNTLNNLYGLSVIKSDKLPDLMLKLSDLLRYSLYETSSVLVPLEKEIKYLENYISLEKIRLEDKTEIIFEVSGNVSTIKIAPMLFIVFVENAFKHGNFKNPKTRGIIHLFSEKDKLIFHSKNEISNQNKDRVGGIGLENIKKRLELIYGENHELLIEKSEDIFEAILKIDLSEC